VLKGLPDKISCPDIIYPTVTSSRSCNNMICDWNGVFFFILVTLNLCLLLIHRYLWNSQKWQILFSISTSSRSTECVFAGPRIDLMSTKMLFYIVKSFGLIKIPLSKTNGRPIMFWHFMLWETRKNLYSKNLRKWFSDIATYMHSK
jgi:hypothetical protein